jgi:hypothetical protein
VPPKHQSGEHECDKVEWMQRIEDKLDAALANQGELKGRLFAHEMVVAAGVTVTGLVLAAWAVIK